MIAPARFDRRLVLEAPTETPDGAGGVVRSWSAVATLWAEVTARGGGERAEADGRAVTVTHRIVLRAGPTITSRHRLRAGERVFRIVALRPDGVRDRLLVIDADERVD